MRKTTLLVICALALAAVAPAGVSAAEAPAEENYVLDVPQQGGASADRQGAGGVPDDSGDGGLPILLVILGGTALAGASIAIIRRDKT